MRRSKDAQGIVLDVLCGDRGSAALTPRRSFSQGPEDPRQRKTGKAAKATAATARHGPRLASSGEESLSPSPGREDARTKPRRVLVARQDPPRAVLRPQREDRARLTPANALLLKSNVQAAQKSKEKPQSKADASEVGQKRRRTKDVLVDADNADGSVQAPKEQVSRKHKSRESGNTRKPLVSEEQREKKKLKKDRKMEGCKEEGKKVVTQQKRDAKLEKRMGVSEGAQEKAKTTKAKEKKEKKREKEPRQPRRSEKEADAKEGKEGKARKEKKQRPQSPRSPRSRSLPLKATQFQPSTKDSHRRERALAGLDDNRRSKQVPEPSERRQRRKGQSRSHRSRSRRREREVPVSVPPEAWQVWRAGYPMPSMPWSAQPLASAPMGVWSVPGVMGQAWALGGLGGVATGLPHTGSPTQAAVPQVAVAGTLDSSSEDSEESDEEPEENAESEEDAEAEAEDLEGSKSKAKEMPKPEKPMPGPSVSSLPNPEIPQEGSEESGSENEESESESQDEDAEIGEAPVAMKAPTGLAEEVKVNWQPPFGKANHGPLHPSLERWPGRKVGWAELYELDIDLNLVKGNEASKHARMARSQEGPGLGDGEALPEPEANPKASADPPLEQADTQSASPTASPPSPLSLSTLIVPHWSNTRTWVTIEEVLLDEEVTWQQRRLCSIVLRSRRKGRTSAGSGTMGANVANPQQPPDSATDAGGSTLLLTIGTAAPAVRLMQWRSPPLLDLAEDVKVDPSKYRGNERQVRQRRRPAAKAKKAAAVKSMPGPPSKASEEYQPKLRILMKKVQDGFSEQDAVRDFWSDLSPADRVQFSTEFPQFMHLVVGLESDSNPRKPSKSAGLPPPPPPKMPTTSTIPSGPLVNLSSSAANPLPIWPKVPAPVTPVLSPEACWADRLTFHDGILRVNMSSLQMNDAAVARWCHWAPTLLRTLCRAAGAALSDAVIDFSGNALEDGGARQLLALLQSCDIHAHTLNLNANRLTEASLVAISDLISKARLPIWAVLLEHNRVQGSYGLMNLARALRNNVHYPVFDKEAKRFTPLMLHLAGNMIERPMQVTQLVKEAFDHRFPSTSEERQYWEAKQQCPPLQLPGFEKQEISMWQ